MKVPVVVATGAGVVITGGLVLIVPAINKDIAYIDKMITNALRLARSYQIKINFSGLGTYSDSQFASILTH